MLTPTDIISGSGSLMGSTQGIWWYVGISGLALAVSSTILAFIYLWGTLFRNAQLNAYVKSELWELAMTAIMIPMIYSAVVAMDTLTIGTFIPPDFLPRAGDGFDVGPTTTIYEAAGQYYLRVEKDMSGWLELNYIMNIYIDQMASVTPYARPLGVGLVASPMAGLASPVKQLLYNMSVALAIAFIVNHAQYMVYIFSLQAFLKYYLPLGFFLRAFTPTRRLGGTLIGVALAFLFFFPAISTITYTMFYSNAGGPMITFRSLISDYMSEGCDPQTSPDSVCFSGTLKRFYESNFTGIGGGLIDLISGTFGGIGNLLQSMMGNLFLMLLLFPVSVISLAFAIGFIVPAFNVLMFTQAAKSLSRSFGEEVDISSLTRMI